MAARSQRLGIDEQLIRPEVEAMNVALVGRTCDRSVTGQMVDFAKVIPFYAAVDAAVVGKRPAAAARRRRLRLLFARC